MNKFDEAASFALKAHEGMTRKRSSTPYILHPFEVATIAATISVDEDVLCAALLHDAVEDTDCTLEEIRAAFGDRVAELVEHETEPSFPGERDRDTWERRKRISLDDLRTCHDRDVHVLWLSDKLSNIRSFSRLHDQLGDDMWLHFHENDPARQAWYYRSVRDAVSDLSDTAAWCEYDFLVERVFEGVS